MNGEFVQSLKTGGKLKVSSSGWEIEYYFAGPDLRYNGTFKRIYGNEIDKYINAWRNNFKKYQDLRESIPSGGDFSTSGEMGMTIRIGGWRDGVCLTSYEMPLNTQKQIDDVIAEYENAKKTAKKLQQILKEL